MSAVSAKAVLGRSPEAVAWCKDDVRRDNALDRVVGKWSSIRVFRTTFRLIFSAGSMRLKKGTS